MTVELGGRTVELTQKKLIIGGGAAFSILVAICGLVFVGRLMLASGVSAMASEDATTCCALGSAPTPSPTVAAATATPRLQRPIRPEASGVVSGTATPPPPTPTPEPRVVVEAYMLNVRAEASGEAEIVGGVEQHDSLVVLDERGEWLRIEAPDGTVGWVHGDYVAEVIVGTGAQ